MPRRSPPEPGDLVAAACRVIAESHDKDRAAEREAIFQQKGEQDGSRNETT